ncbi:MAG: S8 family serine peptidase [Arachnia propionica]|uniref:S8 family peptidase n=1 Tax=Arachnia propionica TaxID=1750 RepID=UPI0026FA4AEC|nr:S8 family serine peptidase [Arachnia propionica]
MRHPRTLAALTLATTLLLAPTTPAHAEDTITDQKYTSLTRFDEFRSLGLTGKGVTIAYIEAAPDLTVAELQGANIEIKNPCNYPGNPESRSHSTAVVSILANRDWGWAPDAHIINYTVFTEQDKEVSKACSASPSVNKAIHNALDDGVDLISISLGNSFSGENFPALLRANILGIPVVATAGNQGVDAHIRSITEGSSIASLNTVVGVGSLTLDLERSEFSSVGDFVTIMAPGEDITLKDPDPNGNLTVITTAQGTSFATPMVTGLLALGKQKWPNATGNQLIRALITTAHPVGEQPNPYYGYGIMQISPFLNTDPTTLEDTNPLFHRPDTNITPDTITDYKDGLLPPPETIGDPTYHYRGLDPTAAYLHRDTSHFGTSPRYHR